MFVPASQTTSPESLNVETLRKSKGSSQLQRPSPAHRNGMHQKAGSPYESVPSSHQTLVTFMWLHKRLSSQGGWGNLGPSEPGWNPCLRTEATTGSRAPPCQERDSASGPQLPQGISGILVPVSFPLWFFPQTFSKEILNVYCKPQEPAPQKNTEQSRWPSFKIDHFILLFWLWIQRLFLWLTPFIDWVEIFMVVCSGAYRIFLYFFMLI